MQKNNITKLLGLQGVEVKIVRESENSLEIDIETKRIMQQCPSCKYLTNRVQDYRVQRVQHISIGKKLSYLNLKKRRYCCHHCGKKFYEEYAFLQKYFRKSNAVFESVCEDLKQLKNIKTIAQDNNICEPTVVRYMHYAFFLTSIISTYQKELELMNSKVIAIAKNTNFIYLILILKKLLILLNLESMTI